MDILIDKNNDVPMYKQIIEQITQSVKNGELKSGDKLPPERELSSNLGIARGTVTKAYMYLERHNIIEVIQGRGSFISKTQDVVDITRKDRAVNVISNTIKELEDLKFTHKEIRIFFDIILMQRKSLLEKINILVIDCNYEALSVFEKQLIYIPDVSIKKLLISELINTKSSNYENIDSLIDGVDFVITTTNHYEEVNDIIGGKIKIIKTAVITSQQTIIDISKIKDKFNVGIICNSERFGGIIKNTLKIFNIYNIKDIIKEEIIEEDIDLILKESDIVILPSYSSMHFKFKYRLEEYKNNGGKIINFEYQIERGSLLYIEEMITNIMKNKNNII